MLRTQRRQRRAFTLIEVLVVVIIIGILASTVVIGMMGKPGEAKTARAKADISTLETALEVFRMDMGRYPNEEEGLIALKSKPDAEDAEDSWKGPYAKRLARDPWKRPYQYIVPGMFNPESYDLVSYGMDGAEGGEGESADIGNWDEDDAYEGSAE